jgi:hypothetical protein
MVFLWFHADGLPPTFALPPVPEIESGAMRPCGSWDCDRPIYMHLIEYTENTVDIQHFTPSE